MSLDSFEQGKNNTVEAAGEWASNVARHAYGKNAAPDQGMRAHADSGATHAAVNDDIVAPPGTPGLSEATIRQIDLENFFWIKHWNAGARDGELQRRIQEDLKRFGAGG